MAIRVLIADDHGIVRSGIRNELSLYPDLEILGEAVNGDETMEMTMKLCPDILLLDINMPGIKAVQILSRIKTSPLKTSVIVFTASDDPLTIREMLKVGVKGYIVKGDAPEDLSRAIYSVVAGKTWLSPTIAGVIITTLMESETKPENNLLGDREIRILQLMGRGFHSAQIGKELFLSQRTINYHIEKIYKQLQVNNRAEAVVKALQLGLIQL